MNEIQSENATLITDARSAFIDWTRLFSKDNNIKEHDHVKSTLLVGNPCVEEKKFTIAIPTFNRFKLLLEAIDSALNQSIDSLYYDVIVVDNNPEMDIHNLNIIKKMYSDKPNFRYFNNEKNIGMFGNWNRCISIANSQWVVLLHDDDLVDTNYLETFFQYDLSEFSVIFNQIRVLNQSKSYNDKSILSRINSRFRDFKTQGKLKYTIWNHLKEPSACCVLYNKKKVIENGGFSPLFTELGFWIKMSQSKKVIKVNKQLSTYRIDQNETNNLKYQESLFYLTRALLNQLFLFKKINNVIANIFVSVELVYLIQAFQKKYPSNSQFYTEIGKDLGLYNKANFKIIRKMIFYSVSFYRIIAGEMFCRYFKKEYLYK